MNSIIMCHEERIDWISQMSFYLSHHFFLQNWVLLNNSLIRGLRQLSNLTVILADCGDI